MKKKNLKIWERMQCDLQRKAVDEGKTEKEGVEEEEEEVEEGGGRRRDGSMEEGGEERTQWWRVEGWKKGRAEE